MGWTAGRRPCLRAIALAQRFKSPQPILQQRNNLRYDGFARLDAFSRALKLKDPDMPKLRCDRQLTGGQVADRTAAAALLDQMLRACGYDSRCLLYQVKRHVGCPRPVTAGI